MAYYFSCTILMNKIFNRPIRLISIYKPTDTKDREIITEMLKLLKKNLQEAKARDYLSIIMGDFNEHKEKKNKNKKMKSLSGQKKWNLWTFKNYYTRTRLLIRWSNKTTAARIDFIYISEELKSNILKFEIIDMKDKNMTDHKGLMLEISTNEIIKNRFLISTLQMLK